ncbi:class I SAM-dependent methyltransferase [Amycolatopsis tolypomycina]|uniref:Ubiquinone/menaquinone biosynthesis C-methylase UbiE n=1 Tax=Amycolatopsis tolypomycina TaxID=208445 RepID=A0A1H4ZM16_9PSEU|nr:class I SAM-dependent methyltransferase [Amycolatopsis tolypomycina]SED31172.1 Ubiquinone/menaquinone biosynthesis C-methylase UbiE [Amycolatopsis tolypomycina]
MPFNHNDHYHPLLLDLLPPGPGIALDVGCGTGRFARRLAATGMAVEAVDVSAAMVEAAAGLGSPGPGEIVYRQADVTTDALPEAHYDYISCLASLHHMPFETVAKLRRALVPGGVLVVLTPARPSSPADWAREVAAVPLNALARLVVYAGERLNGGGDDGPLAPTLFRFPTIAELRRESARLLPGSTVRPLLFWRTLITYREHGDGDPTGG